MSDEGTDGILPCRGRFFNTSSVGAGRSFSNRYIKSTNGNNNSRHAYDPPWSILSPDAYSEHTTHFWLGCEKSEQRKYFLTSVKREVSIASTMFFDRRWRTRDLMVHWPGEWNVMIDIVNNCNDMVEDTELDNRCNMWANIHRRTGPSLMLRWLVENGCWWKRDKWDAATWKMCRAHLIDDPDLWCLGVGIGFLVAVEVPLTRNSGGIIGCIS